MKKNMIWNERGDSRVGAIVAVLVLGALIFVGVQLIPIYYDHWTFQDEFNNEKLALMFVNYPPEKVKEKAIERIKGVLKDMNAQFKDKDIKVMVDPQKNKIVIEVRYARSHKVPFIQNPKQFYMKAENTPI